MKNIFLEISYIKCCEILFSDPIVKSQNWACFWINSIKVLYSLFLLYAKLTTTKMCSCRPLVFSLYKAFFNNKEVWDEPSCLRFYMIFEETYFSYYTLLPDQILPGHWAIIIWSLHFPDISEFPKILSLKSFGNSCGN